MSCTLVINITMLQARVACGMGSTSDTDNLCARCAAYSGGDRHHSSRELETKTRAAAWSASRVKQEIRKKDGNDTREDVGLICGTPAKMVGPHCCKPLRYFFLTLSGGLIRRISDHIVRDIRKQLQLNCSQHLQLFRHHCELQQNTVPKLLKSCLLEFNI